MRLWLGTGARRVRRRNKEPCDVVAFHPLFAGLFKEISAKYPELAALVLDISQVARAAVATLKRPMKVHRRRRLGGEENPGGPSSQNGPKWWPRDSRHQPPGNGLGRDGCAGARSGSSPSWSKGEESTAKRKETNTRESDVSARAQAQLDQAVAEEN